MRLKFKNLRSYFLNAYKKIRDTPSGSAGSPGSTKWPLFDAASFLIDALVDHGPTESNLTLPANERVSYHSSTRLELLCQEGSFRLGRVINYVFVINLCAATGQKYCGHHFQVSSGEKVLMYVHNAYTVAPR